MSKPDPAVRRTPQEHAWQLHLDLETWAGAAEMHPTDAGRYGNTLAALTELVDRAHSVERAVKGTGTRVRELAQELALAVKQFVAVWLPRWVAYTNTCPPGVSVWVHERGWPLKEDFDSALRELSAEFSRLSALLGQACGADLGQITASTGQRERPIPLTDTGTVETSSGGVADEQVPPPER
jgi:hypothetical protein